MSAKTETKTVRVDAEIANRLQTIASLKEEMGEKFRTVEYLNGLLASEVEALYESTLKEFDQFRKSKAKKK